MLAPDDAQYIELEFEQGNCVGIDGMRASPAGIIRSLNLVENME